MCPVVLTTVLELQVERLGVFADGEHTGEDAAEDPGRCQDHLGKVADER